MKEFIYILFIVFGLMSCKPSAEKKDIYGSIIPVDINAQEVINFSDVFDSVEYIPLELNDSFLIGTVERLRIFEDNLCLLSEKSLHIFDVNTGKGKLKLFKLGSGPEEYQSLSDVYLDKDLRQLGLLDMNGKKIQNYDLEGKFINSIILPFMSFSFIKYTDDIYWFYNNQLPSDVTTSKVICYDVNKGRIVEQYFDIDNHLSNYFFVVEGNNFVKDKSGVSFFSCPSNNIYHLDGKTDPQTIFTIDFGKHAVPEEFYKRQFHDIMEFSKEANKHEYVYFVNNYSSNDNYLIFSFLVNKKCFWTLCKIETGKIYTASKLRDDFNFSNDFSLDYNNIPYSLDDKYLYFLVSPEQFLSLKLQKGKGQIINDYLDEQSNPILVKCKLSGEK